MAKVKQTLTSRYEMLKDKNITTSVISTFMAETLASCAVQCIDFNSCESLFFNNDIGKCQLHNDLFMTPDNATNETGLQYFYIIKGLNGWCPEAKGFQLLSKDGPCVKIHSDKKTWHEANQTCESYSLYSRLLIIETYQENELIKVAGKAMNSQFSAGLWIGLSEFAQDDYKWVDGSELNFTDWGNLDNSDLTQEDCVWRNRAYGWHWRKRACSSRGHYICEIEVDTTQYHSMMTL